MSAGPTPTDLLRSLFQAHPWHGVPARARVAEAFNVFVEMVPTDTVKYELDKDSGHLRADRPQRFSSVCPTLYGFVPQTFCGPAVAARCAERTGLEGIEGDSDPIDICVLTEKVFTHGNLFVSAHPIGGLRLIDGNQADDKIVAVLAADLTYGSMRELAECPPGVVERLEHYFLSYKQRPEAQARKVHVAEIYDRAEALAVIARSEADYTARFGKADQRLLELRRLLGR